MDLYKSLKLKIASGKSEPAVWVRRLAIFEKIAPEPVVIRDVHLSRGLNIVWAEESEQDRSPAAITGHSAGKTSFCRLLRYVLGERTFATTARKVLIERAFPAGYVGAELNVRGQQWAVIRPIGQGRASYMRSDATIEELISDKGDGASEDDYPKRLGLIALLDDLETATIVRTGQAIEWGHLLAWCARDQEARFQNCHEWRSPRSESQWSSFRFPRADALFVMRTLLGLFVPDELNAEERLAQLAQKQEQLEKHIEEMKREPEFRVNLYLQSLRSNLRSALPDEHGIDSRPLHWDQLAPDLNRLTDSVLEKLQQEIKSAEGNCERLQLEIDDISGDIRNAEDEYLSVASMFGLETAALTEIEAGLRTNKERLERIRSDSHRDCPYGGIPIGECEYVVEQRQLIQLKQVQDAQALEQAEGTRRDAQNRVERQQDQLLTTITALKTKRSRLQQNRTNAQRLIAEKRERVRELADSRRDLDLWTTRGSQPAEFKELDECQRELKNTQANIEKLTGELAGLTAQHDESRRLLSSIFSGAVRAILTSGAYNGKVAFQNRELEFNIDHGGTMSGEAVETLSILLADVACMVYNSVSDGARLPGFLMHDSPREADLGLGIYRSFIRVIAELQRHFKLANQCPFQYVITTTTPPPEELRSEEFVKLKLNAAIAEKLLFGRVIAKSADSGNVLLEDPSPNDGPKSSTERV